MKKESHVYVMWKNIYLIIFNYNKFDSTRTVTKMSLWPMKFMFFNFMFSQMLCSKNVLLSNDYAFLSKKIAVFEKSYEIGINKLFFSSEEKYSLKKEKYP